MVIRDIKRCVRHLFHLPGRSKRCFPPPAMELISRAIAASEETHSGELRFVIEGALDPLQVLRGIESRQRALEVFSELKIWDTEHNNGALIYVLLADRKVEIIADRGISSKVPDSEWREICNLMLAEFSRGNFEQGALRGIDLISRKIAQFYPPRDRDTNELPNSPILR